MKEIIKDCLKRIFCVHYYKTTGTDAKTLHSQMVCEKCGKIKYNFEM